LGETGVFPVKPRDFEKPSDKRIDAYAELVHKDLPSNVGLKEISLLSSIFEKREAGVSAILTWRTLGRY